jgi:HD-GYP domain-containing protein (c-di-GMP phosphodiesterase class II)
MTQLRTLLIGTALTAMASTAAFAQTAAQPSADLSTQAQVQQAPAAAPAAQGVQMPTPAPQNLAAPGSTDPLVQKRNADAQANAEYSEQKKMSKQQMKDQQKAAKATYKDQVSNAKLNKKADKAAASNELKAEMQGQPTGAAASGEAHN